MPILPANPRWLGGITCKTFFGRRRIRSPRLLIGEQGLFSPRPGPFCSPARHTPASYAQVPETGEPVCVRNCLSSRSFSKDLCPVRRCLHSRVEVRRREAIFTLQRLNDQGSRSGSARGNEDADCGEVHEDQGGSFYVNQKESKWIAGTACVVENNKIKPTLRKLPPWRMKAGTWRPRSQDREKRATKRVDAYNALANRYNAKIDAYHEDVSRFGKAIHRRRDGPRREDGPMEE